MKHKVLSTYKILRDKALNCDIDETWIDWAIEMIEAGFQSENLYILAGQVKPYNQFELQELTNKVLHDLKLDYSDKNQMIKNYVYYLITNSLNKPETYKTTLNEMVDIYWALDASSEFKDFYLLCWAKDDLSVDEVQWYWPEANRRNIDEIITEKFIEWKTTFERNSQS